MATRVTVGTTDPIDLGGMEDEAKYWPVDGAGAFAGLLPHDNAISLNVTARAGVGDSVTITAQGGWIRNSVDDTDWVDTGISIALASGNFVFVGTEEIRWPFYRIKVEVGVGDSNSVEFRIVQLLG